MTDQTCRECGDSIPADPTAHLPGLCGSCSIPAEQDRERGRSVPKRVTVATRLASHGFTLVGMGGNLSAYCRPLPDTLEEYRIFLTDADATLAPTRLADRITVTRVNLALEAEGHSDLRAYRDLWTGTLRTFLAKMDRAQDARMLGALVGALTADPLSGED